MDFLTIIEDKKQGKELTKEQISTFVTGAAQNTVPDYQLAALLMAIRLNGMTDEETAFLTMEMARSGHTLDPDVGGIAVDKHSTGGVGDTTTLVLAPLVAACGGKVLKMSGRGLGHTGGTIDKMESIEGMKVTLPEDEFVDIVKRIGCAVIGQSSELAPADKRLYALRDVTATVDSIPLIASSILSKKFASGAKALVLDVKTGSGALMETEEKSLKLAAAMVNIGTRAGRKVTAVISDMQEPLGSHVGNALEVKEAIDVLAGRVSEDAPLVRVSVYLGSHMLLSSNLASSLEEAKEKLLCALRSGKGLEKLKEMIEAQGGNPAVCEDVQLLPKAPYIVPVVCEEDGFLCATDCTALGRAAQQMGAGRVRKEDVIDPAVGFVMEKRIGDFCKKGETLCTLHARTEENARETAKKVRSALRFSKEKCEKARLIHYVVDEKGAHQI